MRVLDEERDMACSRLTLFLTRDEATQLRDTLEVPATYNQPSACCSKFALSPRIAKSATVRC